MTAIPMGTESMVGRSVVIVGAGIGGLTLAARLAHGGYRVTLLEKNDEVGGRVSRLRAKGFTFDMGPTILLMPDVYETLFRDLGRKVGDYVQMERMETNYRVFFADGETIDVTPNRARMEAGLERLEPGSSAGFAAFMERSGERYHQSRSAFVERRYDHIFQFVNPSSVLLAARLGAFGSLYRDVSRAFRDPRLRATFSFQSMYLGTSPEQSPATFSLLPWTELSEGILFPKGGIYALVEALQRVCLEEGVAIRCGVTVSGVSADGRTVTLADGSTLSADVVVVNADLAGAAGTLVPEKRSFKRARFTSSGVMFYVGLDRQLPGFEHHNVFFGESYLETFDELFKQGKMPSDPAFYVALPNRSDASMAPPGGDAMYVLVPCPSLPAEGDMDFELDRLREQVFDRVSARAGFDIRPHVVTETPFTPADWRDRFALARGSCFGLAHDTFQVAALRPAPKSPAHDNVYYVGASTRPGTGVPLVMIGAKLVAEQIVEEHPPIVPDWEGCAAITEHHAKTFSLAGKLLPTELRRASQAIYAFFRRIDDAVDEAEAGSMIDIDALEASVDRMAAGGAPPDGQAAAMAEIMRRYRIDWTYVRSLLRGVRSDIGRVRVRTWAGLYAYSYRVAGVVGLVMSPILGAKSSQAAGAAVQLGIAMQLTNILRDVGEDLGRDRVYLPSDELARFGITEDELRAGTLAPADGDPDPRWVAFMDAQIARARTCFAQGLAGLQYLHPFRARLCAAAMGVVYAGILGEIERNRYRVFDRRNRVSNARKLLLLVSALWVTLSPPQVEAQPSFGLSAAPVPPRAR